MEISDVYEGDSLLLRDTALKCVDNALFLNRKEQAELCIFLAATRPEMILTAIAAAEADKKKESQ